MICIIAGNHEEAWRWARGQLLEPNEWFYPEDLYELRRRTNFHTIVVGSAGQNVPEHYFENLLALAKSQGRINRK